METAGFFDIHSHVLPSGDDGAASLADSVELCRVAAASGTAVLYGTPHLLVSVDANLPLDKERERRVRAAHAELAQTVHDGYGLDLRLGWELGPGTPVEGGYGRIALQGTRAVLVEAPGPWFGLEPQYDDDVLVGECMRIDRQGFLPVIAHPERCASIIRSPKLTLLLAEHGWPIQVNAQSLTGEHGRDSWMAAWTLLRLGLGEFVGSDGHNETRPPRLDLAYRAVSDELGLTRADALFRGEAFAKLL